MRFYQRQGRDNPPRLRLRRLDSARALRVLGLGIRGAVATVALVAAVLAAAGWLYVLRGLGWLAVGPRVGDSLPLLQLAGADPQPLIRLAAAWLPAGVLAGAVLAGLPRPWRAALAGMLGVVLLLIASQVSFAVARNVSISQVLWTRRPGAGPWIEALLLAAGCAVGRSKRGTNSGPKSAPRRVSPILGRGHFRLRRG
jgi:hypothetical protein